MKIVKSALFATLIFISPLYSLDLKALSQRKELWPENVIILNNLSYRSGKNIPFGTKVKVTEINEDSVGFKMGNTTYLVTPEYTNLSYLVDETKLLESNPASTSPAPAIAASQLPGPDFSFLLDTRIEFSDAEKNKGIELLLREGGYAKAHAQLMEALWKGFESGDSNSAGWVQRLCFARVCFLLSQNEEVLATENSWIKAQKGNVTYKRFKPESLRLFLSTPPALLQAFLVIKTTDDPLGMLTVLEQLYEKFGAVIHDYPSLTGALMIVYDQKLPRGWPHTQVKADLVPFNKETPWIDLFQYFTTQDQASKLLTKIKEMSVSELKFVVDCPLETKELEWALQNIRQSRTTFDKAYFDVEYDESRIKSRSTQYQWPYDNFYTLENIQTKKGICIDQSYFSSIAAKAFGIPSISISGQGANCAHAWLGFMPSGDKWNMKGGRYEANNYVVGFAWDPQTWLEINDHELEYISQRYADTPEYLQSQSYLLALSTAQNHYSPDQAYKLLSEAKNICPKNPEPWFLIETHLRKTKQIDELKNHYTLMIEQFSTQKDWKTKIQESLAKLNQDSDGNSEGDQNATAKLIRDNSKKRSDIAIDIATREAIQKLHAASYDEAYTMFESIIKKFGKENGLMIMNQLVEPFIAISLAEKKDDLVGKCLKYSEKLIDNTERQASLNQTLKHHQRIKSSVETFRKENP